MTQEHEDYYRPDPHADEALVPFDVQGYSGRKGMWLLALVVLILIAILIFLFRAYQPGVRDRGDAPKIVAENTPYKVEPENPGGEEVPNQDMAIYDAMNGNSDTEGATVSEGAEVPIARPGTVTIDVKDRETAPEPEVTTTAPEPVVTTPPPSQPAASTSTDSKYVVQLASLRSRESADETWNKIKAKHAAIIPSGGYANIIRADVPNKGIYYRLRLAGLPDKATADRICNQFKARNQTCFTATK